MALSRRTGQRFQASIWPGFVDAMTGLLLVLMFVLTIFMVVQSVLRETITGQETELDTLQQEVAALADALGLERTRAQDLETELGGLSATLTDRDTQVREQMALISALTATKEAQDSALSAAQNRITSFESQVASLLAQRDTARGEVDALQDRRDALLDERDALNLALAQARTEVDAGAEAARLAAAQEEAMQALIANLRADVAAQNAVVSGLNADVVLLNDQLSAQEKQRLLEAAAAEVLRDRLQDADAELTAMTLALEAQRKDAEDTLTLLAAAKSAGEDLDLKLAAALLEGTQASEDLAELALRLANAEVDLETRNGALASLKAELAAVLLDAEQSQSTVLSLQARVAQMEAARLAAETQTGQQLSDLQALEAQLAAALAAKLAAETDAVGAATTADGLQLQVADLEAQLAAAVAAQLDSAAALAAAQDNGTSMRTRLAAALAAKLAAERNLANGGDVESQLAAALAEKIAAEKDRDTALSAAEQRAALLSVANDTLASQEAQSAESLRTIEVLNQQIGALRTQLGQLQAILDDSADRDAVAQVQLQNLGTDLNAALARAAAEERKRRLLEEAERARLEIETKRLQEETKDLAQYRSEFFGRLRNLLGTQEGVRIVGDRFVFSSEVLFPPGGADLSTAGQGEVAKVAGILQSVIDDIPAEIDWVLRVDGHTDDVPIFGGVFADNWELSQARALSVVRYLIDVLGLPPQRLSANGFGQYQPLDRADTDAARAKNRRIELKFTEK